MHRTINHKKKLLPLSLFPENKHLIKNKLQHKQKEYSLG